VRVENLNLWYGNRQTLFDVNLDIAGGKLTAIIGPAGGGKSALLRCINRTNDSIASAARVEGEIYLAGEPIYATDDDVLELRHRVALVFEKPNPFPMSVFENVVYPLRVQGIRNKSQLAEACESSLRRAALWDEVKDRLGHNAFSLSGGQQQRLCIARALAHNPQVLLLDEPTSDLDRVATVKIEELIQDLRSQLTLVLVAHDLEQASRMSDFTCFIKHGRVVEFGSSEQVFTRPEHVLTEAYVTRRFE